MKTSKIIYGLAVTAVAVALGVGIFKNWPSSNGPRDVAGVSDSTPSPMISQVRPEFTMPDIHGTPRNIKEWDGKVLAVNFWATWCGPCKQEITDFNILQKQYAEKGFQFVGVALDDLEAVQAFLKRRPIDYPVLIGEDQAMTVATHYGDDEGVVPYTAFINRQGKIAFVQFGAMSQDLARQVIESLL